MINSHLIAYGKRITELEAQLAEAQAMLKDGKGARSIAIKTAAWLAMMSHDIEADALDLCERMRIKGIEVRKELDDAMREGEGEG